MSERNDNPAPSTFAFFMADRIYSLLALLIRVGIPAWMVVRVFEEIAGKATLASVAIGFFQGDNAARWYLLVLVLVVIWALLERRLRKRKTRSFHRRIKSLEKLRDSNRTSSMLTEAGDTNPMDK